MLLVLLLVLVLVLVLDVPLLVVCRRAFSRGVEAALTRGSPCSIAASSTLKGPGLAPAPGVGLGVRGAPWTRARRGYLVTAWLMGREGDEGMRGEGRGLGKKLGVNVDELGHDVSSHGCHCHCHCHCITDLASTASDPARREQSH